MAIYRVFCKTDDCFWEIDTLLPPSSLTCPKDNTHFLDLTSIATLSTKDGDKDKDYKLLRKELIEYVIEKGPQNLNQYEIEAAAKNFAIPTEYISQIFNLEERVRYGTEFHKKSVEARTKRERKVVSLFYNTISLNECFVLANKLRSYLDAYINQGLEGVVSGDVEGIFDWVLSTPSTSFENNGLLEENITLLNDMTKEKLIQMVIDILTTGSCSYS